MTEVYCPILVFDGIICESLPVSLDRDYAEQRLLKQKSNELENKKLAKQDNNTEDIELYQKRYKSWQLVSFTFDKKSEGMIK